MGAGISDTISYKIVNQVFGHLWPGRQISEDEFVQIYRAFVRSGGSWQATISGDMAQFDLLKRVMEAFVDIRENPAQYGLSND